MLQEYSILFLFYCFYLRTGASASSSMAASVGGMASTAIIKEELL